MEGDFNFLPNDTTEYNTQLQNSLYPPCSNLTLVGDNKINFSLNYSQQLEGNNSNFYHIGNSNLSRRKVLDAIFGHLEFDNYVWEIVDTVEFQRLRNLKQLGNCHFIYPGGTHTRFEHSLGVAHLSNKLVAHLLNDQAGYSTNKKDNFYIQGITLAGLLHDLGHGPFSHLFDRKVIKFLDPTCDWEHEQGSAMMLDYLIDQNNIDMDREQIKLVQNLILGEYKSSPNKDSYYEDWLFQIVANKKNSIDVDKFDYLSRDSYHIGLNSSSVSYHRIFDSSRIIDNNLCFNIKNQLEIQTLFQNRYKLFRDVYMHKKSISIDLMVKDILILSNKHFDFLTAIRDPEEFVQLDDRILITIQNFSYDEDCQDSDLLTASQMVKDIRYRRLYKYVGQILISKEKQHLINKIKLDDIVCFSNPKDENYITKEDLELVAYSIDYGNGEKDPFDSILFYKQETPDNSFLCPLKNTSLSTPDSFKEFYLFLYCKDTKKFKRATDMFEAYLKKIKSELSLDLQKNENPYSTPTKNNKSSDKFISNKRYSSQPVEDLYKNDNTSAKFNKIN